MDDSHGNWKFTASVQPQQPPPLRAGTKRGRGEGAGKGVGVSHHHPQQPPSLVPWDKARVLMDSLLDLHHQHDTGSTRGSLAAVAAGGRGGRPSPPPPTHSPLLRLHEEILDFEAFMSPTPSEVAIAGRALAAVHGVIVSLFPGVRLEVFGSRSLGLVLPTSDWDLVCIGVAGTRANMQRIASELTLKGVAKTTEVIDSARVPIVKVCEASSNICLDISFDGAAASAAASRAVMGDLLRRFPPARPLVLVLKYFLLQRGLNDTYSGGVGSYLLVLMCVSVVQAALRRAASIGGGGGGGGRPGGAAAAAPMTSSAASSLVAGRGGGGEVNLGALLTSALEMFGRTLNTGEVGVSVKGELGGFFSKAQRGWMGEKEPGLLAVESPADPTQDVGRNSWGVAKAKRAFSAAHGALGRTLRSWGSQAQRNTWAPGDGLWCAAAAPSSGGGSSGSGSGSGSGGAAYAPAYGPVFSPPPASILASVIRVDDLLRGRLEELLAQKEEAEGALVVATKEGGEEGEDGPAILTATTTTTTISTSSIEGGAAMASHSSASAVSTTAAGVSGGSTGSSARVAAAAAAAGGEEDDSAVEQARAAAMEKLDGMNVQVRHKRLLADILTRKVRGVGGVIPAPDGWY